MLTFLVIVDPGHPGMQPGGMSCNAAHVEQVLALNARHAGIRATQERFPLLLLRACSADAHEVGDRTARPAG